MHIRGTTNYLQLTMPSGNPAMSRYGPDSQTNSSVDTTKLCFLYLLQPDYTTVDFPYYIILYYSCMSSHGCYWMPEYPTEIWCESIHIPKWLNNKAPADIHWTRRRKMKPKVSYWAPFSCVSCRFTIQSMLYQISAVFFLPTALGGLGRYSVKFTGSSA